MLFYGRKIQFGRFEAEYLTSKNSKDRDKIRDQFKKKEFKFICGRYFNEGVDIPEIDTVLFLQHKV
jgi:superfamily II DNA or RNA helicase